MHPDEPMHPPAFWTGFYRLLCRLCPRDFRRRFDGPMMQLFSEGYRDSVHARGFLGGVCWIWESVLDLLITSVAVRTDPKPGPPTGRPHRSRFSPSRKGAAIMTSLIQSFRIALRMLRKHPGFSLVVILTVSLGVGANAAMFSVVNGVLLSQLPYEDPDTLVVVYQNDRLNNTRREGASGPDYFDWLEQQTVFERMAAWTSLNPTLTGGRQDAERLRGTMATHTLFETLGWKPALGRIYGAEEDRPGGESVAVISDGLWKRRFGSDPSVIGKELLIDQRQFTILGVMPSQFTFPSPQTDLWLPLQYGPGTGNRGQHNLAVVARLKEGSSLQQARLEMNEIMVRLEELHPEDNAGRGATVDTLAFSVVGSARPALLTLMIAVGLVLVIACVNIANLLLSRGSERERELAIRSTMGAGRARLVLQMTVESLLLAVLGGLLGLALAFFGVQILVAMNPPGLPRLNQIGIDTSVLALAFGIAIVTGFLFGVLPALRVSKPDLCSSLKDGGRSASFGPGHSRTRSVLVTLEVALAFVLVVGAGVLVKSLWNLSRVDPGYEPANLVTVAVNLPASRYPSRWQDWPAAPEVKRFHATVLDRLKQDPRVESAALALQHPAASGFTTRVALEDGPRTPQDGVEEERVRPVSPGYFATIGSSVVRGRDFNSFDRGDSPRVVVVNEAFARKYLAESDPLGRSIRFWGQTREIVGIVTNVRFMGLNQPSRPAMHAPLTQLPFSEFSILVRGRADPARLIELVRSKVKSIDPDLALYDMSSVEDIVATSVAPQRFNAILFGLFAGLALLLSIVGVYGVISFGVRQRTHEFGVRMSLGAARGRIVGAVIGQGMVLAAVGLAIGLAAALVLGSTLSESPLVVSLLFDVRIIDPLTLGLVAAILLAAALLASAIPAFRASRVDPLYALRCD